MKIILIAAVTQDGFIARNSQETITWSKDLKLFKKQTMGFPVIMGSNTFRCLTNPLKGRDVIVVHRNDNPEKVLKNIKSEKCFIAGGGKTNSRFATHLTHVFLTPHPIVFGEGIPLFSGGAQEMELTLEKIITVSPQLGINQYQYKINP